METTLNEFIFQATVIDPIKEIIRKLEDREFRDCDINWLNEKLEKYTSFALETLNKKVNLGHAVSGRMNDNNNARFTNYFKTLLKFFTELK